VNDSPCTTFRPGAPWLDTDGQPIQAHGGGVLAKDGVYYWFGENKDAPNLPGTTRVDVAGVSCYSSRDLLHWNNEGIVLPAVPDDPAHDLHPGKVAERPKVIYNARTRQYVMWLHVDSPEYTLAAAGVAVSERVTGPYRYLGSVRPNGCDSRDMTVFQDDDGRAYLVHSSAWNSVLLVADLTGDYLRPTGHYSRHFDHGHKNTGRESPAVFKHDGKYFLITSGTTGWNPNAAEYAVARAMHGPWQAKGNPCVGTGADLTFRAQDTFVLPMPGGSADDFILLADRWEPGNLRDSRYVWLPLRVRGEEVSIEWRDAWALPTGSPFK
jgi:hypothetical protein